VSDKQQRNEDFRPGGTHAPGRAGMRLDAWLAKAHDCLWQGMSIVETSTGNRFTEVNNKSVADLEAGGLKR